MFLLERSTYETFTRLYNKLNTYVNIQNIDEGDWPYLGSIEANDAVFEA